MSQELKAAAEYILWFAGDVGSLLTNLKLQKLVYYAQAWSLALYNKPIFKEDFEAWAYGPVIPSLYRHYRAYGRNALPIPKNKPILDNTNLEEHLNEVMEVFLSFHAFDLQRMAHNEDPWKKARGPIPVDQTSTSIITKDSMRDFYKALAESDAD